MNSIAQIPSVQVLETSFPNAVEDIKTLFDTNRSPLQPDYTKLSIAEFDLYAFIVYAFMNLFWSSSLKMKTSLCSNLLPKKMEHMFSIQ